MLLLQGIQNLARVTAPTFKKQLGRNFVFQWRHVHCSCALTAKLKDPPSVKKPPDDLPVFQYIGKQTKRVSKIFVWGNAVTGALGIPDFLDPPPRKRARKHQSVPYCLQDFSQDARTVSCGYGFTVLTSSKERGKVWGTGVNTDSQLGLQKTVKTTHKGANAIVLDYLIAPAPVDLPLTNPQETQVLQVACGRAHSLILTDREGVFSLGNNAYGQCGRAAVENEEYRGSSQINRVKIDGKVKQLAAGLDHSLFLTEDGEVYSCGWGADGQTGLGHYKSEHRPTRLRGDIDGEKITQVSTYADCCLAVSEKGDLFGWGNSEYNQLASVTETTQVNVPRLLPFDYVGKAVQVAVGGTICAVLNDQGQVYVWGYGILGKGPKLEETPIPELLPEVLFGRNDFSPDVVVKEIKAGLNSFAAVTTGGELYTWGVNKHGCLGLGHVKDQYFPWKVSLPGDVVSVECGVDHMVAVIKSLL
ncbi:RCC1-like G exchanging factor-like protein [Branchiostoma lanceolatum]|uniref:RCC1-like G exchanging factor-like protein n=1 Tax=Branchiostoma lanceolatum TaxID=7740 RepID=UPI0034550098